MTGGAITGRIDEAIEAFTALAKVPERIGADCDRPIHPGDTDRRRLRLAGRYNLPRFYIGKTTP